MLSFVPDEEIGGADGMRKLIELNMINSDIFEIALDEGLANANSSFTIFYGERKPKWIKVTATGIVSYQAMSDMAANSYKIPRSRN